MAPGEPTPPYPAAAFRHAYPALLDAHAVDREAERSVLERRVVTGTHEDAHQPGDVDLSIVFHAGEGESAVTFSGFGDQRCAAAAGVIATGSITVAAEVRILLGRS